MPSLLHVAPILMTTSPGPVRGADPVTAVASLNLQRYAGRWYEIARLPLRFERKCASDIRATYTPRTDGRLDVHNACLELDGSERASDGVARCRDPESAPGKLQVRFAPEWLGFLPWVWADYWVIALDPDYHWAMVGEPRRTYLWILSREASMSRALLEHLKNAARRMGYDLAPLIVSARLR